jgi:hypothetical protein
MVMVFDQVTPVRPGLVGCKVVRSYVGIVLWQMC